MFAGLPLKDRSRSTVLSHASYQSAGGQLSQTSVWSKLYADTLAKLYSRSDLNSSVAGTAVLIHRKAES